ncbi:hypothetical protein [Flavobacterium sp. SM2513]|uniref:hypothetical protein n=1 Tax=Flavobacterium sp. SM2513 TaxID=3424766 RepID=UPI003D7FA158
MKLDKSSIIDIVVMVLFIAFLLSDVSSNVPYFDLGLPLLWIFFTLLDIYKKRKYLRNIPEHEIRISSNNDSYFSAFPFIAGFIVCVVSLLFYFVMDMENNLLIAYSILGLLLIIQGLQIIPTALIKVNDDNLEFEHAKIKKSVPIHSFNTFSVTENEIRLNSDEVETLVFQHLELTTSEIDLTTNFLRRYVK